MMKAYLNVLVLIYGISLMPIDSLVIGAAHDVPQNVVNSNGVEAGRDQYNKLVAQVPHYGPCWRSAVSALEAGCSDLTEDKQHKLALEFTNCYVERLGMDRIQCDGYNSNLDCMKNRMTDRTFSAYTEFFTHTQSICFYLQQEVWHDRTRDTVSRLSSETRRVTSQLENAAASLAALETAQTDSLLAQHKLNSELEHSRKIVSQFQEQTSDQRMFIVQILDQFQALRDFIMNELSFWYSLLYYVGSLIVIYLITTPIRTASARLPLYLVIAVNFITDKVVRDSFKTSNLTEAMGSSPFDVPISASDSELSASNPQSILFISIHHDGAHLADRLRKIRYVFLSIKLVILAWVAWRYKDYNKINNQILQKIMDQNQELKDRIIMLTNWSNQNTPVKKNKGDPDYVPPATPSSPSISEEESESDVEDEVDIDEGLGGGSATGLSRVKEFIRSVTPVPDFTHFPGNGLLKESKYTPDAVSVSRRLDRSTRSRTPLHLSPEAILPPSPGCRYSLRARTPLANGPDSQSSFTPVKSPLVLNTRRSIGTPLSDMKSPNEALRRAKSPRRRY